MPVEAPKHVVRKNTPSTINLDLSQTNIYFPLDIETLINLMGKLDHFGPNAMKQAKDKSYLNDNRC